jgi:hypothetical protein
MPSGDEGNVEIVRLSKLERPPVGRGTDKEWWEVELESGDVRHTIMLWAAGDDAARVTEEWLREEIARQAQAQGDVDSLYAASPIQLLPPSG